jgi:hypothetical protein
MHNFYKKGWIFLALIFALIFILAFTLSLQSNVNETVQFSTTPDALFRQLMHDSTWHKWWPGEVRTENQKLVFKQKEIKYTVERVLLNSFELKASSNSIAANSTLRLTPQTNGEVILTLTSSIPLPGNPIDRIKTLLFSSRLKSSYKTILTKLSNYYSPVKNLYDIDIKESNVQVEYITTQAQTFSHYPSAQEIYALIDEVKSYIKKQGGTEIGLPMLHVSEINSTQFFTQIGIPTNKNLVESPTIKSKRMLKGGHILTAQVVGNQLMISKAKKQMELYIQDLHKTRVAISYEYLITNRLEQSDSNKWVTQLFFPVI